MSWLAETWDTYFSNATARRDFRTQLRGSKPIFLWSAYLILLMLVGMSMYSGLERWGEQSVANLQFSLRVFYQTIMMLLTGAITLVAPALTAAAITAERQRRSLDLVLSTPIHMKHYLVGKLIGSYRYTWMLLLLSLPLVSMCVILGGATWVDVITAFVKLSLFGLLFTAIGLLLSVLSPKPASAVVYTYLTVGAYVLVSGSLVGFYFMGSGSASLLTVLNPFFSAMAYDPMIMTPSDFPDWLFLGIFVLIACKFLILGAASAMSRYGSAETKSFRIHCLLLASVSGYVLAHILLGSPLATAAFAPPVSTPPYLFGDEVAALICSFGILIHWTMPFVACSSPTAERRNQPDGVFSLRRMLLGTPAGALPFMVSMVALFATGIWGGLIATGSSFESVYLFEAVLWSAGFLTFIWSLCRLASSMAKSLTNARGTAMFLFVCALLIPVPILMAMAYDTPDVWSVYPLYGAYESSYRGMSGLGLFAAGLAIAYVASWKREAHRVRPI